MLELRNIDVAYGRAQILRNLSFAVKPGEIVCLLGRNGAGKTTTMKAIMGQLPLLDGQITLDDVVLNTLPAHEVPRQGIGYIPQGRRLFSELTVAQNLEIGMLTRKSPPEVLERVLTLFPRLRERMHQRAETLSGGEQQMLATARALCLRPRVLLLDEPTEGLQPSMVEAIRQVVVQMRAEGVAVLLVEQKVDAVLSVADRVVFIENGANLKTLDAEELRADPQVLRRALGV
ncbi:ABC transporter ATP-binding protein [Thalassovita taeanensis]|uniref:Amino acid/amide ABC transporter ATP-binding protein 2, HAAT family n=1 Tax=Thalassovita taeanensis TaxID=657014 RepID=A0A1H9AJA2_9RHOB|nr:ABC transporter ATP-binding protein [Thalassovita taeanensis]SEP76834.1 amino acid/amide ABC transporter ATP-binding protein 2, HAAT family [Thalassovita taeanensis]